LSDLIENETIKQYFFELISKTNNFNDDNIIETERLAYQYLIMAVMRIESRVLWLNEEKNVDDHLSNQMKSLLKFND